MGFIPQVRSVVSRPPKKECRQTLLFSAPFTPAIIDLAPRWAVDPIMVEIEPEKVAADAVDQIVYLVTTADKYSLLFNLIAEPQAEKIMVFSNRRDQVRKLADNLFRNGIECGMLSGEVAQNQRVRTLDAFKSGKLKVLVATDVAGRGLHIDDVTHVINYTLPDEPEDYVHRIGRTGRAGTLGLAISLFTEDESKQLQSIERLIGRKFKREIIPGFAPSDKAPADSSDDEYGNFEADPKPRRRGQSKGRGSRGRN
jgi:ATP-dependent RNA helicase RhlB